MPSWKLVRKPALKMFFASATLAAALISTTFLTSPAAAQADQAPPPRIIGAVEVDQLTTAPLQIVRSVSLDATAAEVFALVSDHSVWPDLSQAVESVKITGNGRVGSTRTFAVADDVKLSERILAFNEPGPDGTASFAYSIHPENPFGVQKHLAVIELRPADGGGTVLSYHQLFDHPDPSAVVPMVAAGTDEILANVLYRFGGELRGSSEGQKTVTLEARRLVDVTGTRAWKVLAEMWGEVDEWSSIISHSAQSGGSSGDLEGAIRSCEVPGTPGFREAMIAYDEDQMKLAYRVLEGMPPFITRAENHWTIRPVSDRRVVVHSRLTLEIAPGTPAAATGMAKGQFTQILDLTLDELEHFMETNRPHPRKTAALQMMAAAQADAGRSGK